MLPDIPSDAKFTIRGMTANPAIILGELSSDFKVMITNTAIKLMQGTKSPAVITNSRMEIETAYIGGQLQQGGFAWASRSNGNYGLFWR